MNDNLTFWKIQSVAPFYILLSSTQHPRTLSHSVFPFDLDSVLVDACPEVNEYVLNKAGEAANIPFSLSAQLGLPCQVLSCIPGHSRARGGLSSGSGSSSIGLYSEGC